MISDPRVPLVSIIIPTFNRADLVNLTLESVIDQTYENWECIVVDDGSTDTTLEVIQNYIIKEPRLKFIPRPASRRKGAASCRNIGFEASRGDFIQYLDSDDLISAEKIKAQVFGLLKCSNNSVGFCRWGIFQKEINSDFHFVDKITLKNEYTPFDFFEALGNGNTFLPLHAFLIPRSLISKAGQWNEYLTLNDDGEFMARVLINADQLKSFNQVTAYYRDLSGDNLSAYTNSEKIESAVMSWRLIEIYLQIRYGYSNFSYVINSKNRLYQQTKKQFFFVLIQHKDFFSEQIRNDLEKQKAFYSMKKFIRRGIEKVEKLFPFR